MGAEVFTRPKLSLARSEAAARDGRRGAVALGPSDEGELLMPRKARLVRQSVTNPLTIAAQLQPAREG